MTFLDSTDFGSADPEGVTYNTANGFLYIVDGVDREVYIVTPGPDGEFGNSDDSVSSFDTSSTSDDSTSTSTGRGRTSSSSWW